jgi:hypothetical protein
MADLKKEGFGTISFEDGAKFYGNFVQNRANGHGVYIDENKSIFKGIIGIKKANMKIICLEVGALINTYQELHFMVYGREPNRS